MQKNPNSPLNKLIKTIGPGLIFAGTSIGVSHLVQSTRAGAVYGFGLVFAVVAAMVIKFPFFEFGPRYTIATGEHLLHGYRRQGRWAFNLFLILSLCTMIPIQSAVTLVTTGLLVNVFQWPYEPVYLSAILLTVCVVILSAGKYPLLDRLMKCMIIFLGVSTVFAFGAALLKGSLAEPGFSRSFDWGQASDITFLVALMGWMPTTLEISVWHSFWCSERIRQTGHRPDLKHALMDFHIGYWGTLVMALMFLGLGALVMYGTGEEFSGKAVAFTGQVLDLYTRALGGWSWWVIATAAATTMFSTTICCLDAFPRVIREVMVMVRPSMSEQKERIYLSSMILISVCSVIVIGLFVTRMKLLIYFATTLAFLATPIFAFLNLKTMGLDNVPAEYRPSGFKIGLSWVCLALLTLFSLCFVYARFVMV